MFLAPLPLLADLNLTHDSPKQRGLARLQVQVALQALVLAAPRLVKAQVVLVAPLAPLPLRLGLVLRLGLRLGRRPGPPPPLAQQSAPAPLGQAPPPPQQPQAVGFGGGGEG